MTDADPPPQSPPRVGLPLLGAALALLVIAIAQLWTVSDGAGSHWHTYTNFYSDQADGFLHGELSLHTPPRPELLALPDPYDPVANFHFRRHDAVFFHGKYYAYWGPVPAVLTAGVCWILRIFPQFGDQYLAWPFLFATVVMAAWLILEIRRMMYPQCPPRAAEIAILSLGLGTPVFFSLARAAVYEAAIAAGQFFLLAGFAAAWAGLIRRRPWLIAAAGICWALSLGSRVSLAPAVIIVSITTAWRIGRDFKSRLPALIGLFTPLFTIAALLAWYNFARFGSVTEFGLHYQLAGRDQHSVPLSTFTSIRYIVPNLLIYLCMPWRTWPSFPFLYAGGSYQSAKAFLGLPSEFGLEAVTGVVCGVPFTLLAALGLHYKKPNDAHLGRWLLFNLALASFLAITPVLLLRGATMRYMLDALPCCSILAAAGYFSLLTRVSQKRILCTALELFVCILVIAQCALALILAFTGPQGHVGRYNPALYNFLQSFFDRT